MNDPMGHQTKHSSLQTSHWTSQLPARAIHSLPFDAYSSHTADIQCLDDLVWQIAAKFIHEPVLGPFSDTHRIVNNVLF